MLRLAVGEPLCPSFKVSRARRFSGMIRPVPLGVLSLPNRMQALARSIRNQLESAWPLPLAAD